eukprot:TRINITY_DN17419_c0_g1_i1.p1 TRINITY_DN17419_c0_g1~~TRINITY_DN17419_c0_g1_i1.p1  ORF type:complete len:261 (-),score=61.69 TRINITY_DN17419_c0_g1_i1:63-824(-)
MSTWIPQSSRKGQAAAPLLASVGPIGGTIQAQHFVYTAVVLALGTIFTSYGLSVYFGFVPVWLPDITHTAIHAPSQYIFRMGMIPAMTIFALIWLMVKQWLRALSGTESTGIEHAMTVIGFFASVMLIASSSVIVPDDMPWTFHVVCATGFFILTFVAELLMTIRLHQLYNIAVQNGTQQTFPITLGSLHLKKIVISIAAVLLTLNIVVGMINAPEWAGPLVEWTATFTVISFYLTVAVDMERSGPLQIGVFN